MIWKKFVYDILLSGFINLIILFCFYIFLFSPASKHVLIEYTCDKESAKFDYTLATYLDQITSYYDTLICIILALFAVGNIVAWVVVKHINNEIITQETNTCVKRLLSDSIDIRTKIINSLAGEFDDRYLYDKDTIISDLKSQFDERYILKNGSFDSSNESIEDDTTRCKCVKKIS